MSPKKTKPKAVLISDIHFTVPTLDVASTCLIQAIDLAYKLKVPLIVMGDTLDTKALMRGECVNRLIQLFSSETAQALDIIMLVGNHDLFNEKGSENSLEFLAPYGVKLVRNSLRTDLGLFIAYQSDTTAIRQHLDVLPRGSTIFCHQGLKTAYMGHYALDTSSLDPTVFESFNVISGHYHKRQTIKCGKLGRFSYVGNPYTLSFSEAEDGPKGIQVLLDNGALEFVPTNQRKHVKLVTQFKDLYNIDTSTISPEDKILLKIQGSKIDLDQIIKKDIGLSLFNTEDYRLELSYNDTIIPTPENPQNESNQLHIIIDNLNETEDHKTYLKSLCSELLDETN